MKIAGIVAEYNPFHNGHAYHIERTRSKEAGGGATHIVAVMSGNFMQRGEPALLPKSERVRMALAGGVDLVLELPLPWAMSSAESFAFGAVSILDAMGCVDMLSFGSESGDAAALEKIVDVLESTRFGQLLQYHCDMGISFPDARQRAVAEIAGTKTAALLGTANNTLGIEYIKALRRLESTMQPFTIQRFGAGHDEAVPMGDMASASAIRDMIRAGRLDSGARYMPSSTRTVIYDAMNRGVCPSDLQRIDRAMLSTFRRMSKEDLAALPGISEGLENRVYTAVREAVSWDDLVTRVKTKRYTLTRIQRILLSAFVGVRTGYETVQPPYIRVLGANDRGEEVLRRAKGARLPLLSRVSRLETLPEYARQVFDIESRATDLYALTLPLPLPCGMEYTQKWISY